MKKTLCVMSVAGLCAATLFSADKKTESARIEEIRARHKGMCDLSRSGIQAGYLACRLGLSLTNYLADVEKAWEKNLAEKIAGARR